MDFFGCRPPLTTLRVYNGNYGVRTAHGEYFGNWPTSQLARYPQVWAIGADMPGHYCCSAKYLSRSSARVTRPSAVSAAQNVQPLVDPPETMSLTADGDP